MIKKGKGLQFIRFMTMVVIVTVLMWMIIAGGCLHFVRVRLHDNSMRIDVVILFILLAYAIDILFLTKYVFENGINISGRERLNLDSVRLLI